MKLLVALDLGARTEDTLREATRWGERLGATLDLLFVDDTPDAAVFVGDPSVRAIIVEERDKLVADHERRLGELLRSLPVAVQGAAMCVPGTPAEVIVDKAVGYDAVLVATHGRTGLAHLWLGSVAERVGFEPTIRF